MRPLPQESSVIVVEVAYALPHRAIVKTYHMKHPSTVSDALTIAAADPDFSGVDLADSAVGIFGSIVRPEQALQGGDRIEIYRALAADPKTARRARARDARRGNPRTGR